MINIKFFKILWQKKPTLHPHSDLKSFQRLMLLILTIINHPNLGTEEDSNTNVIHQLQEKNHLHCPTISY